MFKLAFQKLLLAIPLRHEIAAAFTVILGILGLFLPWVYLSITVQDSQGITSMILPQTEITGVFDLGQCEAFGAILLVKPPSWLNHSTWNRFVRLLPLIVIGPYYLKYRTKEFHRRFFLTYFLIFILFIVFSVWFGPDRVLCDFDTQVTIHAYSISWIAVAILVVEILLSCFAYYKQDILKKIASEISTTDG